MDFVYLDRFWLLLALPVLYWLALPPRPRRSGLTPHLAQWRTALARVRRQPIRFRRLRFWLLVLGTCALVLAATRPTVGATPGPTQLVVVVDGSASMLAPGVRTEAAEALREVAAAVPARVRLRAVLATSMPVVFERSDRDRVIDVTERALADATQFREGADLASFAQQVRSDDVRVLTITDALGSPQVPTVGALRCVGQPNTKNVGVVACRIDDAWPLPLVDVAFELGTSRSSPAGESVVVEIRLAASNSNDGTPSIRLFEPVVEQVTCAFEPASAGGRAQGELRLRRPKDSREALILSVTVLHPDRSDSERAGGGDGYPIDDVVRFELPALPAPDVVLLGGDPTLAEAAPWAVAAAETIAELGGGRVVSSTSGRAGFVIVDGGQLATLPPRAILFGTRIGAVDSGVGTSRVEPTVVDWARSDPLLAGIDLSEVRISTALAPGFLPAGGDVLIEGVDGPLAVAISRPGGARTLCLAFRLDQSNLPLLPALPQLLGRAYRAAFGDEARVRALRGVGLAATRENLLLPAETDLSAHRPRLSRPLGSFRDPGVALTIPLLLLGLLALAARAWT